MFSLEEILVQLLSPPKVEKIIPLHYGQFQWGSVIVRIIVGIIIIINIGVDILSEMFGLNKLCKESLLV